MEARKMKSRLTQAAGYLLALAAGIGGAWCFTGFARSATNPEAAAANSRAPNKSGKAFDREHHDPSRNSHPVGSAHRQAWDLLMQQSPGDREQLIPALLAEWIKRDPAGAMDAVLKEENSAQLLEHFSGLFEEDPQHFKDLFADERYGLKTAQARDWWITRMARRDPAALLAQAGEFGPIAREKIARTCVEMSKQQPERMRSLIGTVAALPDTPENRQLASALTRSLASQMDAQELLDRLIEFPGATGAVMIGGAMATMMERTNVEGARATFAGLPDDVRKAAVEATLAKPGKNVSGYLAAMDEVINTPEWTSLQKPLAVRLHEARPGPDQNATLLAWAANMPERQDTMDLYRVAVRGFVTGYPEDARQWIGKMEPGWKQQNSLAAYVQSALAGRGDEAGAQWALEQISDPIFRAEAEGFFRSHEARKAKR
jgi:hypothetical protein